MKLETIQKLNGVDMTRLQETVSNVKASPELGRFKFQIANRWIGAGETRSEVKSFYGCGRTTRTKRSFISPRTNRTSFWVATRGRILSSISCTP